MSDLALFWSYVHKDDDAVGGRMTRLAKAIQNEYELQTGEPLELFVDKSSIAWGEEWRSRIDGALAKTTFLVPVITPRFLQSDECRREVIEFLGQARSLGLAELILPILYVKPSAFDAGPTEDDVTEQLRARHWIDWTDLRLCDEDSEPYRREVAAMAERIIAAIARIEAEVKSEVASGRPLPVPDDDDEPGLFELLDQAQEAMTRFVGHIQKVGTATEYLGSVVTKYTPMIQAASEPRAVTKIFSMLARDLDQPIQTIENASSGLAQNVLEMDPGVLGLVRAVADGTFLPTPENVASLRQIAALSPAADQALQPVVSLATQVEGLSTISRELRRPFRRLTAALRQVADIRQVLGRWHSEIEGVLSKFESQG